MKKENVRVEILKDMDSSRVVRNRILEMDHIQDVKAVLAEMEKDNSRNGNYKK